MLKIVKVFSVNYIFKKQKIRDDGKVNKILFKYNLKKEVIVLSLANLNKHFNAIINMSNFVASLCFKWLKAFEQIYTGSLSEKNSSFLLKYSPNFISPYLKCTARKLFVGIIVSLNRDIINNRLSLCPMIEWPFNI